MRIYLDNGATTKVDPKVLEIMNKYFTQEYGNPSSLHNFGEKAKEALDNSRKIIADKIQALPEEIIFTSGGSESDNLAIKGVAYQYKEKGNHIITSKIEHPAILRTCEELEKQGFEITYLGVDHEGFINLEQLKKSIKDNTILVTIIHANNEIGTMQDLKEIYKICQGKKVLFHTDAVQSFCKNELDSSQFDIASFSAHKLHGPKGVGALFIKKGIKLKNQINGGPQESKLRAGTENIPGIVGFAEAVKRFNQKDINQIKELKNYLHKKIEKEIPHIKLNGPKENRLCSNLNISFRFIEGEALLLHLDMAGIAVSTGSACSSHSLKASHVLLAIGLEHEVAHGSIRFTLSKYNKKEEIDYTVKKLKEAVQTLREISPLGKEALRK